MKVCHTLICFFFLTALQDGDTGEPRRGMKGENITVSCSFSFSGSRKFFCRENCEGENILIDTTEDSAQRGRYSIKYENKGFLSPILYVSITDLKPSDSGRYRCSLDYPTVRHDDFSLTVTEASDPNWTLQTFPSSFPSSASETTAAATSTQRLSSSSSSSSPETTQQTRTSTGPKGLLLYVVLTLVAKIILLSTPLVIFCWKRRVTESKDPAAETENAAFSQTKPAREEIRDEDRQNKSSAEEISLFSLDLN